MNFVVIGITDHPQPFLTPDVMKVIQTSHHFSGGKRHHERVAHLLPSGAQWVDITIPLDNVFATYREIEAKTPDTQIVVFASGDPLFFGFANTLRQRMPHATITLHAAFNSLQMLAHRLLMPYHDMRIVSLTGRPWQEFDRALIEGSRKTGILTDREHTPKAIAQRMLEYGYDDYLMHIGEHLGHPTQERVSTLTLDEAATRDCQSPNCLILTGNHQRRMGIPDAEFELLHGRERMITKMPIRLLSLQAMQLHRRKHLWDIGFCTGSISIEARLQHPHLDITAFEIRPEGLALMETNSRRFGAPGIRAIIGDFLECDITTLPRPDAVFIGGHGGRLKDIMQRAASVLSPGGCMVMNAVTPNSVSEFKETCKELGMTLLPPLHISINDYNPIDILTCEQPS